jgi:hypothetical protein
MGTGLKVASGGRNVPGCDKGGSDADQIPAPTVLFIKISPKYLCVLHSLNNLKL